MQTDNIDKEFEELFRKLFGYDPREEAHKKIRADEHQSTTVENIKSLMKNTGWTVEESMANLGVAMDQRSLYADLVKK